MLREIMIENVAVIEKAGVQFGAGLNVLSGETGAGKSTPSWATAPRASWCAAIPPRPASVRYSPGWTPAF